MSDFKDIYVTRGTVVDGKRVIPKITTDKDGKEVVQPVKVSATKRAADFLVSIKKASYANSGDAPAPGLSTQSMKK